LQYLLFPIVYSIERMMHKMHRWEAKIQITDEEIESFIDLWKESWVFEPWEYEKIKKMLDFYETDTEDIMTPRVKIEWLPQDITVSEALFKIKNFSHSRLPVFKTSIDDSNQVISIKELITAQIDGKSNTKLSDLDITKAVTVPLTAPIHKTLETFRKTHKHMALVIDEYGGVAGVITVEDIIEQVFGDFKDETDREETPIKIINSYNFIVQADVRVNEILDLIQVEFGDIQLSEDEFGWETLGYVLMAQLGRFPQKNEQIVFKLNTTDHQNKEIRFIIKSISPKRIQEVEILLE